MAACLIGWLGFGIEASDAVGFIECLGYERVGVGWAVGDVDPSQVTVGVDIAGPVATEARFGGVFDAPEGGHCLCHWPLLPPYIMLPGRIPAGTYVLFLDTPTQHAVNAGARNPAAPEVQIGKTQQLGTVNGRPLVSGCRLVVAAGQLWCRASYVRRAAAA